MTIQVTLDLSYQLYERAESLAQRRRQEITAVIEDLLEAGLPLVEDETESITLSESDEAMDREREAYIAMHPLLKEKFFNKHVAVYGGQLVGYDEDFEALYERIEAQYPDKFVWLSTVEEEPIPTIRVRSPRFVQDE
jgi:hypothetical protein